MHRAPRCFLLLQKKELTGLLFYGLPAKLHNKPSHRILRCIRRIILRLSTADVYLSRGLREYPASHWAELGEDSGLRACASCTYVEDLPTLIVQYGEDDPIPQLCEEQHRWVINLNPVISPNDNEANGRPNRTE